jgi:molybdopterin-containing oxidoreductase family iron-sulfur binding subunit
VTEETETETGLDYAMIIDLDRCIGCHTCAVACKVENDTPMGIWWNRVLTVGGPSMDSPDGEYPNLTMHFLPFACQHCDNPPCVKVCPTGATYKRADDGAVVVDYERCIGCRYCMAACPYGVRTFNWGTPEHIPDFPVGFQEVHTDKYSSNPRYVYEPIRPVGVVEKCSFFVQRIDNNQVPFCINVCPARARLFGSQKDPNSEVSKLIKGGGLVRLMPELGTGPEVFFIPPRKKGTNGQLTWNATLDAKVKEQMRTLEKADGGTDADGGT